MSFMILINAENFIFRTKGKRERMGFYATRFSNYPNESDAIDDVKRSLLKEFKDQIDNISDIAWTVENVQALDPDDVPKQIAGATWYAIDSEDS